MTYLLFKNYAFRQKHLYMHVIPAIIGLITSKIYVFLNL